MTDKERLGEMKEKLRKCCLNRGIGIFSIRDIEWFIQRAERVQELERNIDIGAKVAVKTAEKLHYEQQQNKRYREALEEANRELINLYNNLLDHKVTADEAIENIELIGINIIQDALKGDKK